MEVITLDTETQIHPSLSSAELKDIIISSIDESKGEEIVTIDLAGKTDIADYMIVASSRSGKHAGSVADKLVEALKAHGVGYISVEGMETCDWVLVDTMNIIVHILRPEVREYYNIEKMWKI